MPLYSFSIPWCKKVKNAQKFKSRGPGYIASFVQKTFFTVYPHNLLHHQRGLIKEPFLKNWRELDNWEECYVNFSEGKCAAKSSKRSRKPRRGQDMPLCNSIITASVLPFSGWFMVWMAASTGRFWWRACSPQHHAKGSHWSDQADPHQPDGEYSKAVISMPERADAKPCDEAKFKCHDLEYVAQTGILLVLKWWSYQHYLAAARLNHGAVTFLAVSYAKWDALLHGSFTEAYVQLSLKMPKESGRLKSRLVRSSRNTREKLSDREGKVLSW